MKISPIKLNNFPVQKKQSANFLPTDNRVQNSENKNSKVVLGSFLALSAVALGVYFLSKGRNKINFKGVDSSNNLGNKIEDIIITGSKRVKKLFSEFDHNDFDSSKEFKANFHIHSTYSDGKLTPLQILEQAVEQAKKLPAGKKFSFSVTDHDNIDGVLEIVNEIKSSPEKYSKINFVPGIEMSVKHSNKLLADKPVEMDFLIYGFDVENPKLIEQIQRRRSFLIDKTSNVFDEINVGALKNILSVDDMIQNADNSHLRCIGSNGYLKALRQYIDDKLILTNTTADVKSILLRHFGDTRYAYDANISLKDAVKLSKEIDAVSSIAHPGKFNFNNIELKADGLEMSDDIIKTFIDAGGDGIESHYMSYKPGNQDWWERIRASFKKYNFDYIRTGGYDTHNADIRAK